jgi:hypothetical protein
MRHNKKKRRMCVTLSDNHVPVIPSHPVVVWVCVRENKIKIKVLIDFGLFHLLIFLFVVGRERAIKNASNHRIWFAIVTNETNCVLCDSPFLPTNCFPSPFFSLLDFSRFTIDSSRVELLIQVFPPRP